MVIDFKTELDQQPWGKKGGPIFYSPELIQVHDALENIKEGLAYILGKRGLQPKWQAGYDEIVKWNEDNGCKGLVLQGPHGCGKSILTTLVLPTIINHYLENMLSEEKATGKVSSHRPRVEPGHKLVRVIHRGDMNTSSLKGIPPVRAIFMDDLGEEPISQKDEMDITRNLFKSLIDAAEKYGILLIVSTELTIDELNERYGARLIDRLRTMTTRVTLKSENLP